MPERNEKFVLRFNPKTRREGTVVLI